MATPDIVERESRARLSLASCPAVHIVVLNWNGRSDTHECLASLRRLDYANAHVLVVDNGSTDGSLEALSQDHPDIPVLATGRNLGFAAGNNHGIEHALRKGADFVLLLNNDTVVDSALVSHFVEAAAANPNAAVFGPKILHYSEPNKLWYAGGYWDEKHLCFAERGAGEQDRGEYDERGETEWVIGCAMFIRASTFETVGTLEPAFFLNNEEIDFCSRVHRAGGSCMYVPQARVWHKVSASFGGAESPLKTYFNARNRLLWAQRNAAVSLRVRIYMDVTRQLVRRFFGRPIRNALMTRRPLRERWWAMSEAWRDPVNRAFARGVGDYCLRRYGPAPPQISMLNARWVKARLSTA